MKGFDGKIMNPVQDFLALDKAASINAE